ncbi:MAG: glucose 1-dehydrogenase [Proteobacteria bacterium]|nr:glucose 1-dehydrogenase [Pseudomonadota bacterium]
MGKLEGKVALITGAGNGIGYSQALLFAQEGASVIATDVDTAAGEKLIREIQKKNGKTMFFKHDVAREEDWSEIIAKVTKAHGKLDILVNNAGILIQKDLENTSAKEWEKVFEVNAKGPFLGCKYVAGAMRKAGGGSIINILSIGGPSAAAYEASKGAVQLLTKAAAIDYAKDNIRVNSIYPGLIETSMTEEIFKDRVQRNYFVSKILLGRAGLPIEVAKAVLFLASDDASYMTGSELVVDGGYITE